MSNSHGYRGNPALHAARDRQVDAQRAASAAATEALAAAGAEAAEAIPDALVDAGIVLPARRRPAKAETSATSEQER